MKIVLVHGFNVRDGGKNTIDKFAPEFRELGYAVDIDEADYGYWNLFAIYFGGKRSVVRRLIVAFHDPDLIITHSNGASFANKALKKMQPRHGGKRLLVHFSPALNRRTPIPLAVDHQFVYHTRGDWVVRMASYLPFLPWGRMGAFGYKGKGPNTNIDRSDEVVGHSNWFKGFNVVNYPRDIHARIEAGK